MPFFWLFVAGLSVGWLGGLSESPIASSLLTAIIAAVVGATTTLVRSARDGKQNLPAAAATTATASAPAIAAVVLGMAFGVPAGITVRAHAWLGPPAAVSAQQPGRTPGVGWFDKITDSCAELRSATDKRAALSHRGESGDRVIAACNGGDACLHAVIDLLCGEDAAGSSSR